MRAAALAVAALALGCGSKRKAEPEVVAQDDAAPVRSAPSGPAPPEAGTTRVTLERLVLDLDGAWAIDRRADGTVWASPDGVADAAVLVMPSFDLAGATLTDALVRGIDASTAGRTLVKAMPPQPAGGTTKGGVPFVGQLRVTTGAAKDTAHTLYYAFDLGGRAQVVALIASSAAAFQATATAVGTALEQVQLVAAAPSAGGATSDFAKTVGGTVNVASVGESARLAEVKFEIAWQQPYARASAYTSFGFLFTRDASGNLYLHDAEAYDGTAKATVYQSLQGKPLQATAITHHAVATLVAQATSFPGTPTMWFDTLTADAAGDLFVGGPASVEQSYNTHGEYVVWRRDTGKPEVVVTHPTLQGLSRGPGWGTTSYFRPTPDGGAWLFVVTDSWPRVLYFERGAAGWSSRELDVTKFAGGGDGPSPTADALTSFGCPDFTGGWVFYSNGAFWRLSRDGGPIQPVLRMALPSKGVTLSNPVVLANGDLWFAALSDDSSVAYLGPDAWGHGTTAVTHQSILLGDRARWIRARLDGKGNVSLGEIAAEALLPALAKAGATIDGGVLQTPHLEADLTSGGILTYDSHHEVLFAVRPLD